MTRWTAIASVVLFTAALVSLATAGAAAQGTERISAVFPGAVQVTLEVAADEATRQRGLMHRRTLGDRQGMIFVFAEPDDYHFWMKNTLIALDIFWLDDQGTIVFIHHAVPPCGNRDPQDDSCPTWGPPPGTRARYVIEMSAGFAARHKVRRGQRVRLSGVPPAH